VCGRLNRLAAFRLYRLIIAHSHHSWGVRSQATLFQRDCRANEAVEERVRSKRTAGELWVELARHEPGVIGELNNLDEATVWRDAREVHPGRLKLRLEAIRHLKTVAVALVGDL
jgi:hypothetical protein